MADDIPSGAGMTLLATAIANFLAEDLTADEMNVLGNFLTVVCSCLFLLASVEPPHAGMDEKGDNDAGKDAE